MSNESNKPVPLTPAVTIPKDVIDNLGSTGGWTPEAMKECVDHAREANKQRISDIAEVLNRMPFQVMKSDYINCECLLMVSGEIYDEMMRQQEPDSGEHAATNNTK